MFRKMTVPELEELLRQFQQAGGLELPGARRVEDFSPDQVVLGAPYFPIDVFSPDHPIREARVTRKDQGNCGFGYIDDNNRARKESYNVPHGALVTRDGVVLVSRPMFELFVARKP